MISVQYSKTSEGKVVLMGETLDNPGIVISKTFNSFDEAVEYADNH